MKAQISRLRTICEVEQAAANNPFARLAINTIKWEDQNDAHHVQFMNCN